MYLGETISLIVAVSWTATALFAEVASKRIGSLSLNVLRMLLSLLMLGITLWITIGSPYPLYSDASTWLWLSLSGFIGYVLGDYCLFRSYILIGSRFGQLFMTLAPPAAAISAWIILGEQMNMMAICGMLVTITGIAVSVLNRNNEGNRKRKLHLSMPIKGVLYAIGAGVGQGVGLVFSKMGMKCYEVSIPADQMEAMSTMIPFASTYIRAVTGLIGFALIMLISRRTRSVVNAARDSKAMKFTFLATLVGPFLGVSLSLMATLHTHAGIAQTIMSITPVLILWPSYFFFHQKITTKEIIGAVISVLGVSLFFI